MADSVLLDGEVQSFYFPEGHDRAGVFKGMAIMLEERGHNKARGLDAECKGFKCVPPALNCCCRRILFNEPDFANVDTILEVCEVHGFRSSSCQNSTVISILSSNANVGGMRSYKVTLST